LLLFAPLFFSFLFLKCFWLIRYDYWHHFSHIKNCYSCLFGLLSISSNV
jgi:hypothetical protein